MRGREWKFHKMTNKNDTKKHFIEFALSLALIAVTGVYTFGTLRIADLMQETNRAELRPYLYIKFLDRVYFKYNNVNSGILLYTLTNNGKVSAYEIIRSYKVYKITGDTAIISRSTYVNTDFVYALAPQETLEGQPDQIDGINFSNDDVANGSYYLIELYVSYRGTVSVKDTTYYSKVEIKIQPRDRNDDGHWNYILYLIHRDEGTDQNLKKFWEWHSADHPEIRNRQKQLENLYKKVEDRADSNESVIKGGESMLEQIKLIILSFFLAGILGHFLIYYLNRYLRFHVNLEEKEPAKLTPTLDVIERTIYCFLFLKGSVFYTYIGLLFGLKIAQRLIIFSKIEGSADLKDVGERANIFFICNVLSLLLSLCVGYLIDLFV